MQERGKDERGKHAGKRKDENMSKTRGKKCGGRAVFCAFLCMVFAGCGDAGEAARERAGENLAESLGAELTETVSEEAISKRTVSKATISEGSISEALKRADALEFSELPGAYQQMALYIQEGFRRYQVEGSYRAYFSAIENENRSLWVDGKYCSSSENTERRHSTCDILLERGGVWWNENLAFEYDEEADWYIFASQYEPVLSQDTFYAAEEDSSHVADILGNYVYEIEIARDAYMAVPIRYTSENGPVEKDERIYYPWTFQEEEKEHNYFVAPMIYSYRDERVDTDITIYYPQLKLYDEGNDIEEIVNRKLREAFFYGYGYEEGSVLVPDEQIYTDIDRYYKITREDDRYLSMRIYEYNSPRRANHPNEWETGLTLDLRTGERVYLKDVLGEDFTPEMLFGSGAFRELWGWEGDAEGEWFERLKEGVESIDLSAYDSYYYLTDTGLGLITFEGRYYTNLEAEFEDLGVEGFYTDDH
jgi:hypothetical protein